MLGWFVCAFTPHVGCGIDVIDKLLECTGFMTIINGLWDGVSYDVLTGERDEDGVDDMGAT